MAIKGIFFDAADVFYERDERTDDAAARILMEAGYAGPLSAEDKALLESMYQGANVGFVDPVAYWDQVLRTHRVDRSEERAALVAKILAHANAVRAVPGGPETLAVLKRRGFLLGIVTDTIYPLEQKMDWLEQVGVAEYIDVVACSSTLGVRKPDPAIFLNAVQQARLSVVESAFVGHDARELEGAKQVGLATVAVRYDPQARADYYAETLPDLLDVPIFERPAAPQAAARIPDIEAIFLDVGNTLRIVVEDATFQAEARQQLRSLVGAQETPETTFFAQLDERWKAYRKWSFETLTEASEKELWTRFMLPDFPAAKIGPLAGKLTRLWRDHDGRRVPRPDVKETVLELNRRGYRLGIIANTITETEIPDWIESDGLTGYFQAVVLSSKVRNRKPGPEIYWEAARRIGVEPARCVYVGDNPLRDVEGTRRAGFGMIIILMDEAKKKREPPTGDNMPDVIIRSCRELLDIFPLRVNDS